MDWLDRMNNVMDYIENNLSDEISYARIAEMSYCSTYHFQRMFPFITGVSLSEYIRHRRLTQAAFELQTDGKKIIDIALKYGYESPEAFARAFKNLHGVTPSYARDRGVALKTYPKMIFQIQIKGDTEMMYRIEERESFKMFGVYGEISRGMQQAFKDVPEFRKKCDGDGSVDEMNSIIGRFHDTLLHAALYDHTETSMKYMICCNLPMGIDLPDRFTKLNVPAMTWVIFTVENMEMQKMWKRIYSEWFPASEYDQAEGPGFEMCYGMARHGLGEIWIPVKEKQSLV